MIFKSKLLKPIQFCGLAAITIISAYPSLACVWDIFTLTQPQKRSLISYHFNISPNALIFDKPYFFRHGELQLISQRNEKTSLTISSPFFKEIRSPLVRVMDYHFFLAPARKDNTNEVIKSFLRFKYCTPQNVNDAVKSIIYRVVQKPQLFEIETECPPSI